MSEATEPFNQAVHAALIADPVLVAFLGGEYVLSGVLAQDVKLDDFVVLDTDDSLPWLRFNGLATGKPREGAVCGLMLDCWSRIRPVSGIARLGKQRVLQSAGHLARILNNVGLTMPSYGFVLEGRCEIESSGRDPGLVFMHARCRYQAYVTRQPGDLP